MNSRLTILAALSLLPVLVARGALETARHDTCGSLVFDGAGDLAIAANDVAVSRFSFDDGASAFNASHDSLGGRRRVT